MRENNGIARADFTRKQRYATRRTYTKTRVYVYQPYSKTVTSRLRLKGQNALRQNIPKGSHKKSPNKSGSH